MSGGMIDGAIGIIEPQGEPTPEEPRESAPTLEPTPTEEPTPEPTETPEPTAMPSPTPEPDVEETDESKNGGDENETNSEPDNETGNTDTVTDIGQTRNEPSVPDNQESAPVTGGGSSADYSEQLALMQESLETLVVQNAELKENLLDVERVNGMFLVMLLAVIFCEIFWRRILR